MGDIEQVSLTIGGLLARTERLENDVQEIMKSQKEILEILNRAQGSWKTMVVIGGISLAIGTAIGGIVGFWANIKQIFGK